MKKFFALACIAALLGACGSMNSGTSTSSRVSSDGVWSSVMGYHGPISSMDQPGGPN